MIQKILRAENSSKFYRQPLKQFKMKCHKETNYSYSRRKDVCKIHTKRFESNLISDYGSSGVCSHDKLSDTSVKYGDKTTDTEASCHKCGWKILYVEGYKKTEQGWDEKEYYYHTWCHE